MRRPQTALTTRRRSSASPSPRRASPSLRRSATRSARSRRQAGKSFTAGPDGFKKALQLIKDGKPIRYEGVIGPVSFDQYGDITGPFRLWRIQNGEVTTVGEMGADAVQAVKAKLPAQ